MITIARRPPDQNVILEHLHLTLSILFELVQFSLCPCLGPGKAAALVHLRRSGQDRGLEERLVRELQEEWMVVLGLESTIDGSALIRRLAPYTLHQKYREIMTAVEAGLNQDALELIESWYPAVAHSAQIENVFCGMTEAIRRTNRNEMLSLTNLQAVAMRSTQLRICGGGERAEGVSLDESDWEGREVHRLKESLFNPASVAPCILDKALKARNFFSCKTRNYSD